ncbi:MAG: hypothetical protein GY827_03240 [Cytophagales bacterium]|nr:hypothetical protein [Cytophagales bacterium]
MLKKVLSIIFGVLLILGGIGHIASPEFYSPMIPSFIPEWLANALAAISELIIGALLLLPKYRKQGWLLFMLLMIAFLPIHIWDAFKETPVIGPHPIPTIRIVFQFVFIFLGWKFSRKEILSNESVSGN